MILRAYRVIGLLAILLTFGCSSDDDGNVEGSINEADLIGTWNINTLISELPLDLDDDGIVSENLHTEIDCIVEQLVFNEDGTWSAESEFALEFLNELQGVLCFDNSRSGDWSISGNTLTLTATGVERSLNISLTSNTLSFNLLGGLGFNTTDVIGSYQKQ